MYNLSDFACCIRQMKQEFRASFHQPTKFSTYTDRQTYSMGHLLPCAVDSKQITHPYICNGLGYLAWQLSCAMIFQWGLANRKSAVMPLSAATSSVWRTLWPDIHSLQVLSWDSHSIETLCMTDPIWIWPSGGSSVFRSQSAYVRLAVDGRQTLFASE